MNIFAKIRRSFSDESGAVTVDWVVLTASVVILAIGAIVALQGGLDDLVTEINSELDFDTIEGEFGGGTGGGGTSP